MQIIHRRAVGIEPWTEWITFFGQSQFCLSSFCLSYNEQQQHRNTRARVPFSTMEYRLLSLTLPFTASNGRAQALSKASLFSFNFIRLGCACMSESNTRVMVLGWLFSLAKEKRRERKTLLSLLIKSSHVINGWKMLSKGMQKEEKTTTENSYASMVAMAPLLCAHFASYNAVWAMSTKYEKSQVIKWNTP